MWNILDCIQVAAFFLYLALKSLQKSSDIAASQLEESNAASSKAPTDSLGVQSIMVLIVLLKAFLITHCFVKVVFYLRIYDNVRQFILLVSACVDDFIPFFYFFASQVLMFSFIFSVLDVKFGPPGQHTDLNPLVVQIIQVYQNSVGAIAPPGYDVWVERMHEMPYTAWSMITLIWLAWFMNQFLLLIILLNFINATFGASNEAAMSNMDSHRVFIRATMNRDCLLSLRTLGLGSKPVDTMIIKHPDFARADSRWHGYTRTVQRCIEEQTEQLSANIKALIENITVKNKRSQDMDNLQKQIGAL